MLSRQHAEIEGRDRSRGRGWEERRKRRQRALCANALKRAELPPVLAPKLPGKGIDKEQDDLLGAGIGAPEAIGGQKWPPHAARQQELDAIGDIAETVVGINRAHQAAAQGLKL